MSASTASARPFDIVVWGANGFTGRKIVQVLAQKKTVRFAAAGRDPAKVRRALKEAGAEESAAIITADLSRPEELDAMCRQARVVIACAGPFTFYGLPVAESCVRTGAHYIDITGEPNYVRSLVEKVHASAIGAGVSVIPCCGFDSVPSDLTNWTLHRIAERKGQRLSKVETFFSGGGGPSRGTLDSMMALLERGTSADFHPLAFIPKETRKGIPLAGNRVGMWYNGVIKRWTAPFFMAAINEKVARRSNFLMDRKSIYTEASQGSFFTCLIVTIATYAFGLLLIPAFRKFCVRFFPPPREGPSAETMAKASFSVTGVGYVAGSKDTIQTTLKSNRGIDGYIGTALMASEVALALANDEFNADNDSRKGGVVTPAFAVGDALVRRLSAVGIDLKESPASRL